MAQFFTPFDADAMPGVAEAYMLGKQRKEQSALNALQRQQAELTLADLVEQRKLKEGLKTAISTAAPEVFETQVPNPAYPAYLQQRKAYEATMSGMDSDPSRWAFLGQGPPPQAVPETITQRTERPANLEAIRYRYIAQNAPDQLPALQKEIVDSAANLAKLTGNHKSAVDYYNQVTGGNVKYVAGKDNFIELEFGNGQRGLFDIENRTMQTFGQPKVDPSQYKSRSYTSGNQEITEESYDGGMTWKPLATAPRYKPASVGSPKQEKDIPTGIQDKIGTKLEIYNDWAALKDGFRPEFMPRGPVKSIGEMQLNLNKIFGGNQDAIDWWMRYFDARNIILKERSGAAVMEPEFRRFEQGAITANTNPITVKSYLDRSTSKYKQHVDGILNANRKNHPESIKAYEEAYGYRPESPTGGKGGSNIPPAAVEYLKKNPNMKSAFDAKYGAGAAKRVLGR